MEFFPVTLKKEKNRKGRERLKGVRDGGGDTLRTPPLPPPSPQFMPLEQGYKWTSFLWLHFGNDIAAWYSICAHQNECEMKVRILHVYTKVDPVSTEEKPVIQGVTFQRKWSMALEIENLK